ncbi:MAG TPA: protoglobin domain-containing protein [Polyangia bacterium]|nr:protoglobin domain-containing protein [Polyangia bacterium]
MKAYVGFTDEASVVLRAAHAAIAPHFGPIIDDFYATIEAHPGARAAITGGADQIDRLKKSLLRWIDELFRGPHDEAYFERRARIGRVHVQIDLPQVYMFAAMDRIRVRAQDVLRRAEGFDAERATRTATALDQILDIELAIMLETYREDLVAKNRTAERLSTIGQFAAGIGHELRNPLGVVESSAFLVSRRLQQLQVADVSVARHMDKIVSEVQRSNKTITDLLELARSKPLKRRVVDAREFVERAVPAANVPADVKVEITAPPGIPLDADPDQLARVVTNLVINASQAMGGRGHVWIDARREREETVIVVRDDGPGVPSDVRARIFEALFTTKAKGSGLGLALCRRIAEAHGGRVTLDPSDRGAAFRVTIPDAPAGSGDAA